MRDVHFFLRVSAKASTKYLLPFYRYYMYMRSQALQYTAICTSSAHYYTFHLTTRGKVKVSDLSATRKSAAI